MLSLDKFLYSRHSRICFNWLLFCFTVLLLSSCSSRSVRTGYGPLSRLNHSQLNNKAEKNRKTGPEELLSELSASQVEATGLQDASAETNPDNTQLVSLKKQLQSIENNHNSLDKKVGGIQNDVADMKQSIEEIKDAIRFYHEGKKNIALTGGMGEDIIEKSIEETYLDNENDDFIILPDEALQKKSKPVNPAPKPKRRKISKSGSAHSRQKPDRASENVDLSPSSAASGDEHTLNPDVKDALRFFSKKNYQKAISRLIEIVNSEDDPMVKSDCNYWLGESHFGLKQFDKAVIFFIKVVDNTDTPKRDDAQIMIAECYVRSGKIDLAKKAFTKLVNLFAESEYKPRARKMLQQL